MAKGKDREGKCSTLSVQRPTLNCGLLKPRPAVEWPRRSARGTKGGPFPVDWPSSGGGGVVFLRAHRLLRLLRVFAAERLRLEPMHHRQLTLADGCPPQNRFRRAPSSPFSIPANSRCGRSRGGRGSPAGRPNRAGFPEQIAEPVRQGRLALPKARFDCRRRLRTSRRQGCRRSREETENAVMHQVVVVTRMPA
jgi:hypothetical protein